MTRVFILLAATGFASACMSSGPAMDNGSQVTPEESVSQPTDGLDNETTAGMDS